MPRVDFDKVDETGFTPIPDGAYLCDVEECEETHTKAGDDMFKLTLKVAEGKFRDRKFWDNLVFNGGGLGHVKIACRAFGFDVSKAQNVEAGDLVGKTAIVTVITQDYVANDGSTKKSNKVTYDGYAAPSAEQTIGL